MSYMLRNEKTPFARKVWAAVDAAAASAPEWMKEHVRQFFETISKSSPSPYHFESTSSPWPYPIPEIVIYECTPDS